MACRERFSGNGVDGHGGVAVDGVHEVDKLEAVVARLADLGLGHEGCGGRHLILVRAEVEGKGAPNS